MTDETGQEGTAPDWRGPIDPMLLEQFKLRDERFSVSPATVGYLLNSINEIYVAFAAFMSAAVIRDNGELERAETLRKQAVQHYFKGMEATAAAAACFAFDRTENQVPK